MAMLDNTVC